MYLHPERLLLKTAYDNRTDPTARNHVSPMSSHFIEDTLFILLYVLPTGLLCYCMLVSREARGAVLRLPVTLFRALFTTRTYATSPPRSTTRLTNTIGTRAKGGITQQQWRAFATRKFSPREGDLVQDNDRMLKREVDRHNNAFGNTNGAKRDLKQLFSSSPPKPITDASPTKATTRPLSLGNGNARRPPSAGGGYGQHGIKRSASGFAKSLTGMSRDSGFDEPSQFTQNSRQNPIVLDSPPRSAQEVYFDENDFDSDVDLEVEDVVAKGQVGYPKLPQSVKGAGRSNMTPTLPRQAEHTPSAIRSTPSEQMLPWSSSAPEDPVKTPTWDRYAQQGKRNAVVQSSKQVKAIVGSAGHFRPAPSIIPIDEEPDEQPRPAKRRTLPWQTQNTVEETVVSSKISANNSKKISSYGVTTPMRKPDFPWTTSASALKEQQKKLRQATKKIKANEGTEADKSAAIEKKKSNRMSKVFLSEEQRHVLQLVKEGKSMFFTGSAGTGKSVLLREIIAELRLKYAKEPDRVAVTASTGLAACNVGGVTLHSYSGIGLGKEDVPTLVKKIKRSQKARHRWMRTKVLIVDEVSMVDGELFDKLEAVARTLRNNGRPFGGIQLVITGDFFQLPPVPEKGMKASRFAFEAATWNTCIEHTIALHHVFRQKDPEFAAMLNEMREGRLSQKSIARFKTLNRELRFDDELLATELFPTRFEVEKANAARMHNLQGDVQIYDARDGGSITDKIARDKLLQNCMAPETLSLKKGAQVMLLKNLDETLVNGSLGQVIGFMSEAMFDNYQANEEEYYATQADGEFGAGGPELSERKMKLKTLAAGSGQVFPVVRFAIADGSTRDLLCQRESWKVELPNGEVQASRSQVPLILAWALSIHKAQGQTLERVKVDLGRVFEKGQAYVALSRATSMKGLQVTGFNASKVMAHEKVRQFYAGLSKHEGSGTKFDQGVKKTMGAGPSMPGGFDDGFGGDRYLEEDFEWDA